MILILPESNTSVFQCLVFFSPFLWENESHSNGNVSDRDLLFFHSASPSPFWAWQTRSLISVMKDIFFGGIKTVKLALGFRHHVLLLAKTMKLSSFTHLGSSWLWGHLQSIHLHIFHSPALRIPHDSADRLRSQGRSWALLYGPGYRYTYTADRNPQERPDARNIH